MFEISVIVPVFNVEKYIRRCLDSILAQSYTNFELILVDDGSSDSSANICDEYQKKESRIRVIHQENLGVSAARNTGLLIAKGEYVVFCDADDKMTNNALLVMHNAMLSYEADMVISGVESETIDYNNNTILCKKSACRKDVVIYREMFSDGLSEIWTTNNMLSCWGKMYKKAIIEKAKVSFDESLVVLEDFDFVLKYLDYSNALVSIKETTYCVCSFVGRCSYLHRSKADYVDDVRKVNSHMVASLKKWGIKNDDAFWEAISPNFEAALESLWAIPSGSVSNRLKKYRRIKNVLVSDEYQRFTQRNSFKYSKLEKKLLLKGNVITMLLLGKIKKHFSSII